LSRSINIAKQAGKRTCLLLYAISPLRTSSVLAGEFVSGSQGSPEALGLQQQIQSILNRCDHHIRVHQQRAAAVQ